MVTLLLQYKSDPNHRDVHGNNPLYHAVKSGNLNTIKWLLLNFSAPTYTMLSLTEDEQIISVLTVALEISQSLSKLNFAKRHENWKPAMQKALGL